MPKKIRPPVLVLGSGLTVLGAIRLLHQAGYDPLVVASDPGVAGRSRWFQPAPPSTTGGRPEDDLDGYLDGLPIERAPLLPCSDAWMLRVARSSAAFADRFPASVANADVLERLIDKWHLAEALTALGLPHPRTVALDAATDLAGWADPSHAGAFIKPRDSAPFFAKFGVKAFRVQSREDIVRRLATIESAGFAVQLQEYVPGPPENHYYVEGFIDSAGEQTAVFVRRRLRMYPPDFGNSTAFESVVPNAVPDAVDVVCRLLRSVDFRGIFSVEFKRDERDGICRLIEVNARPWWYVEFAGQCGVNFCELSIRDALGERSRRVDDYLVGRRCVYPYYDYYACRALHREGKLTLGAWAASWATATQPVFRWSDPVPALSETAALVGGGLGRRVRQALKRPGQQ